jgi:methylmalonyl-CoA mutase C-terminal domain/subunit
MANESRKRILIAKPGLDGHDRGAKVVARALSNAGMEVIYTGLHQTPFQIVNSALDEDVDVIGISVHSGAHKTIFTKILSLLKEKGVQDVLVIGGGTIPKKDREMLKIMGVDAVFGPGSGTNTIIDYINNALSKQNKS